jgi:hypothetical protein
VKTLKLSKSIQAHGETLTFLELREPTYEDIAKCGNPISYGQSGDMKIDHTAALAYLPVLGQIPLSSVKMMSPPDLLAAQMLVVSFFTPSETPEDSDEGSTT